MTLNIETDSKKDLTIFTVVGMTTFKEIMRGVKSFYEEGPTKYVLWDFSEVPIWDVSGEEVEKLAGFAPRFDEARQGAKTAIIAPDELTKALSQLFVMVGHNKDSPIKVQLFQTRKTAMDWIFS